MSERTVGYQRWQNLLFLHWRVEPEALQACLPSGLTVDSFDGSGWLAMVPFSMERVRPWWSPAVPGISWFLETNLRTYVKHDNGDTGVWFFTLDANHRLAVTVARRFWHLNYRFAKLSLQKDSSQISYRGRRTNAFYHVNARIPDATALNCAKPKSLEHFLLERYRLLARAADGRYFTGLVHHSPYQFAPTSIDGLQQNLTATIDCSVSDPGQPDHVAYSPGVDVSVSGIHRI